MPFLSLWAMSRCHFGAYSNSPALEDSRSPSLALSSLAHLVTQKYGFLLFKFVATVGTEKGRYVIFCFTDFADNMLPCLVPVSETRELTLKSTSKFG